MYHPSYLTPKTILKIQTAQRSATLPLIDHLRISLEATRHAIMTNGRFISDATLQKWQSERDDLKEQIRILENITPEAHADFLASL